MESPEGQGCPGLTLQCGTINLGPHPCTAPQAMSPTSYGFFDRQVEMGIVVLLENLALTANVEMRWLGMTSHF